MSASCLFISHACILSHTCTSVSRRLASPSKEQGSKSATFVHFLFSLVMAGKTTTFHTNITTSIQHINIVTSILTFSGFYSADRPNTSARCLSRRAAASRSADSQKCFIHSYSLYPDWRSPDSLAAHGQALYLRSLDLLQEGSLYARV